MSEESPPEQRRGVAGLLARLKAQGIVSGIEAVSLPIPVDLWQALIDVEHTVQWTQFDFMRQCQLAHPDVQLASVDPFRTVLWTASRADLAEAACERLEKARRAWWLSIDVADRAIAAPIYFDMSDWLAVGREFAGLHGAAPRRGIGAIVPALQLSLWQARRRAIVDKLLLLHPTMRKVVEAVADPPLDDTDALILRALVRAGRCLKLVELADHAGRAMRTCKDRVKELKAAGLVKPNGKRGGVCITDLGRDRFERMKDLPATED